MRIFKLETDMSFFLEFYFDWWVDNLSLLFVDTLRRCWKWTSNNIKITTFFGGLCLPLLWLFYLIRYNSQISHLFQTLILQDGTLAVSPDDRPVYFSDQQFFYLQNVKIPAEVTSFPVFNPPTRMILSLPDGNVFSTFKWDEKNIKSAEDYVTFLLWWGKWLFSKNGTQKSRLFVRVFNICI